MSDFIDIRFFGDKELQKKLRKLELDMQAVIVKDAIKEGTQFVLEAARSSAPVKTGALRRTISKSIRNNKRKEEIVGLVKTGTRKQLGIPKDAKYYYPAHVELGTSKMEGKRFMRDALNNNIEIVKRIMEMSIRAGIRRVVNIA